MKLPKSSKSFLSDVAVNIVAFGIYMFAYHIVLLPQMADTLSVDNNAKWLLYLMIAAVIYNSLGYMLGTLYQVHVGRANAENATNDINILRLRTNLILLLFFPVLILLNFTVVESLFFTLTTILSNERSFLQAVFRQKRNFKAIAIGNAAYLVGVFVGLLVFRFISPQMWIPIFVAELFVVAYSVFEDKEFRFRANKPSEDFRPITKEYFDLTSSTVLANIPTYGDKILILPLLGSYAMSAYYAGGALAKVLMLLINPINGVILSWLTASTADKNRVVRKGMSLNVIMIVVVFIITLPVIYLATRILYPQFLDDIVMIIIPLALDSTFAISTTILRTVYLRYFNLGNLKFINIGKIILFAVLSVIGAHFGGLLGFAYGKATSTIIVWVIYFLIMHRNTRSDNELQPEPGAKD